MAAVLVPHDEPHASRGGRCRASSAGRATISWENYRPDAGLNSGRATSSSPRAPPDEREMPLYRKPHQLPGVALGLRLPGDQNIAAGPNIARDEAIGAGDKELLKAGLQDHPQALFEVRP